MVSDVVLQWSLDQKEDWQVAAKLESCWKAAEKKATNHEWLTSVVPLEKIFTPKNSPLKEITSEKYSPLKNIFPLKNIHPLKKYSPLKNIHPLKKYSSTKYSPLKIFSSEKYLILKNIHP